MKCPFCNKYTRVWYVPFHEKCMQRVETERDEEENQIAGKMKREMTIHLIQSICESKVAKFRCEEPIAKK